MEAMATQQSVSPLTLELMQRSQFQMAAMWHRMNLLNPELMQLRLHQMQAMPSPELSGVCKRRAEVLCKLKSSGSQWLRTSVHKPRVVGPPVSLR